MKYILLLVLVLAVVIRAQEVAEHACAEYCLSLWTRPQVVAVNHGCNCYNELLRSEVAMENQLQALDRLQAQDDASVFYEPAGMYPSPIPLLEPPFYIINPAFRISYIPRKKHAASKQTVDKRENINVTNNGEKYKIEHHDSKTNKTNHPIYLDVEVADVKNSEGLEEATNKYSHALLKVENNLAECIDLHILAYSRNNNNETALNQISSKFLAQFKSLSDTELTSAIEERCSHTYGLVHDSVQEIKEIGHRKKYSMGLQSAKLYQEIVTQDSTKVNEQIARGGFKEMSTTSDTSQRVSHVPSTTTIPIITGLYRPVFPAMNKHSEKQQDSTKQTETVPDTPTATVENLSAQLITAYKVWFKDSTEKNDGSAPNKNFEEIVSLVNDYRMTETAPTEIPGTNYNYSISVFHSQGTTSEPFIEPDDLQRQFNGSYYDNETDYNTPSNNEPVNREKVNFLNNIEHSRHSRPIEFDKSPSLMYIDNDDMISKIANNNDSDILIMSTTEHYRTTAHTPISSDEILTLDIINDVAEKPLNTPKIVELPNETIITDNGKESVPATYGDNTDTSMGIDVTTLLSPSTIQIDGLNKPSSQDITGHLYFNFNSTNIPVRFLQNPQGGIDVGIDGTSLCDKLVASNNYIIISKLCNCLRH